MRRKREQYGSFLDCEDGTVVTDTVWEGKGKQGKAMTFLLFALSDYVYTVPSSEILRPRGVMF